MKTILALALITLAAVSGCKGRKAEAAHQTPAQAEFPFSGKVLETMDASTYTYVKVSTARGEIWAAAPKFPIKVGDMVGFSGSAPMPNYTSKTLNRTFELVYFEGAIANLADKGKTAASPMCASMPSPHGSVAEAPGAEKMDFSGIKKPEGGKTIAELFGQKQELAGKSVVVCGKVVKINTGILGKNWVHLRDGTGAEGSEDLTVTTLAKPELGSVVRAEGILVKDKDFGSGYKYALIVEDAKILPEK